MSTYIGIFLEYESEQRLIASCPPRHPQVFAEHMTLFYAPDVKTERYYAARADEVFKLAVTAEHWNKRGQCVSIAPAHPFFPEKYRNRIPHITISTARHIEPSFSSTFFDTAEDLFSNFDPQNTRWLYSGHELLDALGGPLYGKIKLCSSERKITTLAP